MTQTFLAFTAETSAIAEKECRDCNAQIASICGEIMVDVFGLKKDNNGSIIVKEGKQPITGWANPRKAYNLNTWWILSPKERWPNHYDQLVDGFEFEVFDEVPKDWHEPHIGG